MKKVFLSLAFVLAIGSSAVNASSSDEIIPTTSTENIQIVEEFGCASDCVQTAKQGALLLSSDTEDTSTEGELMEHYRSLYYFCYQHNCA
jgi:hypothetical protein